VKVLPDLVGPQPVQDNARELVPGHADVDLKGVRRLVQTLHVLLQPEDSTAVNADTFKDPVREVESAVEHRDAGLACRDELAVDVDP